MSARSRPSRRSVLKSAGLSVAALPVLDLIGSAQGATASAEPQRLPGLPAKFSVAERDRRWQRVRAMMRREGFDCLVAPAATTAEGEADSRYLTQRAGWVVFPLDGPVVLVADRRDDTVPDEWVGDVRVSAEGLWSPLVIDALREAKMQRARIGVGRLVGSPRAVEGDVSFTTLDRVRRALPGARFDSATDQMIRIKLLRSDEEIALLEKATAAGERGIEAMVHTAKPGVWHKDVWLAVFTALAGATGEDPSRIAIRSGGEANTSTGGPMLERLQSGQIMNQEIAARAAGFMAQVNHSIAIGTPHKDWASTADYCTDVLEELIDWVRPGRRFMDLCERYARRAVARMPGLSPTWVLVHTCGLGDGPRMGARRSETTDLVIEPTMVFTLKPRIIIKGVTPAVQFGDPILVTDTGARRLGRRSLKAITKSN